MYHVLQTTDKDWSNIEPKSHKQQMKNFYSIPKVFESMNSIKINQQRSTAFLISFQFDILFNLVVAEPSIWMLCFESIFYHAIGSILNWAEIVNRDSRSSHFKHLDKCVQKFIKFRMDFEEGAHSNWKLRLGTQNIYLIGIEMNEINAN